MTLVRVVLGAMLLLLTAGGHAHAQQRGAEVRADVDQDTVAVGDVVRLHLKALSSEAVPVDPKPGATTGFTLHGPSVFPSTSVMIMNGVRTDRRGIDVTWTLRADRPGTFRIGPASVAIGGTRVMGRPIMVTVLPPGKAPPQRPRSIFDFPSTPNPMDPFKGLIPNLPGLEAEPADDVMAPTDPKLALEAPRGQTAFLHAVIDKTAAVVGEQVTLSVYLYEDPNERGSEYNDIHEVTAGDFLKRTLLENDAQSVPIGNAIVGGRLWTVKIARKSALFPLKVGDLEIGPMTLALTRASGTSPQRESEKLHVQVREPPMAGRPAGYVVGDVGRFELSADVTPRDTERGDAVGVTLELSGTGNLPATLPMPARAGLEWLDPEVHEKLGATRADKFGGKRTFSYVLRVKREGAVDLGEVTLPYWNPEQKIYEVARARLGSLTVRPGAASVTAAEAPPDALPGLPAMQTTRALPRRRATHVADSPLFWFGLGASPLAFALVSGARAATRRIRKARSERATSPVTEMKERTVAAEAACKADGARHGDAAIARALESALIACVGVNVRAATGDALATELVAGGVAADDARAIQDVYRACEAARFSPDPSPAEEVRARWARARSLIQAMGKSAQARTRARE